MPGIEFSLSANRNNSSNMKIDALNFLHILLTHHEPEVTVFYRVVELYKRYKLKPFLVQLLRLTGKVVSYDCICLASGNLMEM